MCFHVNIHFNPQFIILRHYGLDTLIFKIRHLLLEVSSSARGFIFCQRFFIQLRQLGIYMHLLFDYLNILHRLLNSLVEECQLRVREVPDLNPSHGLLDSLVVECWLRVREVPGSNPSHRLLDSLVVECWLRVLAVPGSILSQGLRHTKDVIKIVPVVPLFSTEHLKGKYWLFLKN